MLLRELAFKLENVGIWYVKAQLKSHQTLYGSPREIHVMRHGIDADMHILEQAGPWAVKYVIFHNLTNIQSKVLSKTFHQLLDRAIMYDGAQLVDRKWIY
jgi:hypothetical protein